LKKLLVLVLPVLATMAVALAPASASGDTFYKCPHGVTDHHYCTKYKKCKVPELKGKTVKEAKVLLREHDCRLGKVHHTPIHNKHKGHHKKHHKRHAQLQADRRHHKKHHGRHHKQKKTPGRIYKQSPRAGTIHKKGHKVAVWVYGGAKKHHHHKKHHHKHHR
jgi:beta-lactam-binding protein with PASTA domain